MRLEALFRWVTATLITGAAVSELTRQPTVMLELERLGYPATLVWIIGPAKLAAVAALLLRPRTDLARAAWLGLWINLAGAVASILLAPTAPWPDAVVAATYLGWISIGALLHERAVRGGRELRVAGGAVASAGLLVAALSAPRAWAAPSSGAARALDATGGAAESRPDGEPATSAPAPARGPWWRDAGHGVETSALWPIYPGLFFQARAHVDLPVRGGGLLVGTQFRLPQYRETEGTFNNVDAQVGWRQHAWLGLHGDVLLNAGWGRLRDSTVNGRDYDSLDLEVQALLGWRQTIGPVYVALQPLGLASVVYRSNPWPIAGEGTRRTEPPIYIGNVVVGVVLGPGKPE